MQCQYAQDLFSDYITGDLDRALAVTVKNHLSDCDACREELAGVRRLWTSLDAMPVVEPPVDLHAAVMKQLDAELLPAQESWPRPETRGVVWDLRALFRPRVLAVAATLLVCLLGGAGLTQSAALDPFSALMHWLKPSPLVLQTPHAKWVPGADGVSGVLQVRLLAADSGNAGTLKVLLALKRHQPGGADVDVHSEQVTLPANTLVTVQFPLDAQPAPEDYSLSVTPNTEAPKVVKLPAP